MSDNLQLEALVAELQRKLLEAQKTIDDLGAESLRDQEKLREAEKRALALENLDVCVDRERMVSIRRDGDELVVAVTWKGHEWAGRVDMEGNPKSEPAKG